MAKIVLPTLHNWDCHHCTDCCRTYHVRVSEAERVAIEAQAWDRDRDLHGLPPVVYEPRFGSYRLNHTLDGSCVFLDANRRCKIHEQFGAEAKPLACRLYPFTLTPAGDHWAVGLRYSCPSAARNEGRAIAQHRAELEELARRYEADVGRPLSEIPPPELLPGQQLAWPDVLRIVAFLADQLDDNTVSLEYRLRVISGLARLGRKSKLDNITGERLSEFLKVVQPTVVEDVLPRESMSKPSWVGRLVFRQILAIYCRQDNGPHPGIARHGRFTRLKAAWRFAVGSGPIPALHGLMPPDARFEAVETQRKALTPASDTLLTRFYRLKLQSLPFCGLTNFGYRFWDGLDSLLLTYPAIRWLSQVLAFEESRSQEEATEMAVRIVDDNFGYNPALGTARLKWATGLLSDRDDLTALIAWYG